MLKEVRVCTGFNYIKNFSVLSNNLGFGVLLGSKEFPDIIIKCNLI